MKLLGFRSWRSKAFADSCINHTLTHHLILVGMTGEASIQTTKFKFQVLFKTQYGQNRRGGKVLMGEVFSSFVLFSSQ